MIPLPRLLRDSCIAAVAFAAVGQLLGAGLSVAAGSVAGVLNLAGLILAVSGPPGALLGRLAFHNLAALVGLYMLLTRFEPLPAMIGILAPLVAITVRVLLPSSPVSPAGVDR